MAAAAPTDAAADTQSVAVAPTDAAGMEVTASAIAAVSTIQDGITKIKGAVCLFPRFS